MEIDRLKIIEILKGLLIGFLVLIGTFPENDWSFSPGIDPPLSWAFNYIFQNGLNIGEHIVFPHGPLAFFIYPLPENIILATLIISLLKIILVFNIFLILNTKAEIKWIIAFVVTYAISIVAGFNQLIFANIILFYCNYFNRQQSGYKTGGFILTAFSFYVKSNIAIISGIVTFSFLLYYFIKNKNYKKTVFDLVTIVGLLFLFWLIMYGTFAGLISYTVGMFHLAQDNSSAVSCYPYNNWWVLAIFLIILFLIPFINKTKKSTFFGIIITLSIFAVWKYGMAREDNSHIKDFLIYVLISLSVFNLFHPSHLFKNVILSVIAIVLLGFNMQNAVNYSQSEYKLFRANNFIEFVFNFSELKTKSIQETQRNISSNKLPQGILDSIGTSSVDIYPWDYSIISANNLKWQPRVVIQSYASYTSWLDKRNAEHFGSEQAPDFIVWELNKISQDFNGSDFNSLDYRYLPNDEPQTIVEFIINYKFYYADSKFLVLKKREISLKANHATIGENSSGWGQWINVPESANSLLRAKLTFSKSLVQRLKRFLYKDEQFWIYLKLRNGLIHRFRIVPGNASDGIWINPYIYNLTQVFQVKQIMFKCSNQTIMTDNLVVEWEKTEFEKEPDCVVNFFNPDRFIPEQMVFNSINTFEAPQNSNWNKLEQSQTSEIFYSSTKSHLIKANSFSSTFRYPLDSLAFGDLKIYSDCWMKSPDYRYARNISFVLSINDENGNIIWKGLPVDEQLIDQHQWNNILNYIDYKHCNPNCTLGAYISNTSNKDVYIDDFRVIVFDSATKTTRIQ